MEFQNEEHAAKLLKAQTHIWNHIFSFINSMSLKCAVELGIPDAINSYGKPMPLSKLISSLPSIHPSKTCFIHRLMRILTHSGFFTTQKVINNVTTQNDNNHHDGDGEIEEYGYVLTDSSKLLIKDNPLSITTFLLAMLDPSMTNPWNQFSNWFQNDDPTPFKTEHGMGIWEYAGHVPRFNHLFNDSMACDSRLVASVLIEKGKGVFEGLGSLVDVGGGTGTMAKAIAKAFPKMECTVYDLPHVVASLEGSENLKFVGGDMFEAIPPSDAILLKWILHDWNDEKCLNILRKCKESIMSKGKEGKVIVIDMVMTEDAEKENDESIETQNFLDMVVMVLYNSKERNEKEWAKLIFSAGFTNYKITPILGLRSLIEIYP